jgi:protein SCO1/2
MKLPGQGFKDTPQDYSMDHSAQLIVLDPQALMAVLIQPPFNPQAIAADLLTLTQASK